MSFSLYEELGYDENDPKVIAAKEDVAAYENLILQLLQAKQETKTTISEIREAVGRNVDIRILENLSSDGGLSSLMAYARAVNKKLIVTLEDA